jgi:hypothetical protein
MKPLALTLMIAGGAIFLIGALLWLGARFNLPLGRLPGDFRWKGENWSVYFPFMTVLILSILLTLILNLFLRK